VYRDCSNINKDSPLSSSRVKKKSGNLEISGFHSAVISLLGILKD